MSDWECKISELRDRVDYLESEMERRDAWLINSIWQVVGTISAVVRCFVVFGVLFVKEWDAWWQICLGFGVLAMWWWFDTKRLERLEVDDKIKIARQ